MVQVGLLLSDVPSSVPPAQQFNDIRRIVAAAQRNDFTYIAIGQHFLYGDLRWLRHYGFSALDVPTLSGGVGA